MECAGFEAIAYTSVFVVPGRTGRNVGLVSPTCHVNARMYPLGIRVMPKSMPPLPLMPRTTVGTPPENGPTATSPPACVHRMATVPSCVPSVPTSPAMTDPSSETPTANELVYPAAGGMVTRPVEGVQRNVEFQKL